MCRPFFIIFFPDPKKELISSNSCVKILSDYYMWGFMSSLNHACTDRVAPETLDILANLPYTSIKDKAKGGFMSEQLTQERLKKLLRYDPVAGVFTWLKTTSSGAIKGDIAGSINGNGYRTIGIAGKSYIASRLAWLYMEGYWPEHYMDHRNRTKYDDRWENLRHVSPQCNTRNSKTYNTNTSGITGVCWNKEHQAWQVYITVSEKRIHLGRFKSKLDAARTRWNAEVRHKFPNCNTTSSAYLYIQKYSTKGFVSGISI